MNITRRTIMKALISRIIVVLVTLSITYLYAQNSGYKITRTINIGGEGGWDYLSIDKSSNRLFVSHANKVVVIDLTTESVIGEINNQHGVHGIAFVPSVNKGFITNGKDSSVTIFDLKTLKVLTSLKLQEKNPDAILYEPFSNRVFTFNNHSASATAIDPNTNKIIGTVKLDGDPEAPATDLHGKVYVNLEDKSAINVFDPKSLKVLNYWPIDPCKEPSGLAIDLKNKRLFSVGRNNMMAVINAENGNVVSTVPIGSRVDGCAFDESMGLVFSSNGDGTMTIVKELTPDKYEIIENIPTQKGARTIALDENTHKVYTSSVIESKEKTQSFGVMVIDKK